MTERRALPALPTQRGPDSGRRDARVSLVVVADGPPAPGPGLPDDPTFAAIARVGGRSGVTWVGRDGVTLDAPPAPRRRTVAVAPTVAAAHDHGQATSTLWPLYHDLGTARHETSWREAHRQVNAAYAAAVAEEAGRAATVWIQDYRLQLLPGLLRRRRPDLRIGLHLPIPFPGSDLFQLLPMRDELLDGLLGADLLGFQTAAAAENFHRLAQDVTSRVPAVAVLPTAADTATVVATANQPSVRRRAAELRRQLGDPRLVLLSINTADDSQGNERRLRWFGDLLDELDLDARDIAFVQILIGESDMSTSDTAGAATRVNGRHAAIGRPVVHFLLARPTLAERVALYLAADIMLATPHREGATTVALEFAAAARPDSALILSEFSGTAAVLDAAFVVNPHDDDAVRAGVTSAIHSSDAERTARMDRLRTAVSEHTSDVWAGRFLGALADVTSQRGTGGDPPQWIPLHPPHAQRRRQRVLHRTW